MSQLDTRPSPRPDDLWLSRPPHLMIAHVVAVEDDGAGRELVSYELHDEDGCLLKQVEHAPVDGRLWRGFQPLTPRFG